MGIMAVVVNAPQSSARLLVDFGLFLAGQLAAHDHRGPGLDLRADYETRTISGKQELPFVILDG